MAVVNEGAISHAPKLFDLAMNLEVQVGQMLTQLEYIQDTQSVSLAISRQLGRCRSGCIDQGYKHLIQDHLPDNQPHA
ncbi:MAG: hypothetical protein ACKN9W_18300 [Methylococcus sp.]